MSTLTAGLWIATAFAVIYGVVRLASRLKVRGMLYDRSRKSTGGSAPLFLLQEAVEPQSRHVREVEEHTPSRREDEDREPEQPRLFRSGDRFDPAP